MTQIIDFAVSDSAIQGLRLITLKQVEEDRGTIREFLRPSAMAAAGIDLPPFRQINVTETKRGAVRGMHGEDMIKVLGVVHGSAHGAWVDVRPDSPTRGAVVQADLLPGTQVVVPAGVCNGFQATSDDPAQYVYLFTQEWVPGMAGAAVNPLDPALGITWPIPVDPDDRAQVSQKDAEAPTLAQVLA